VTIIEIAITESVGIWKGSIFLIEISGMCYDLLNFKIFLIAQVYTTIKMSTPEGCVLTFISITKVKEAWWSPGRMKHDKRNLAGSLGTI
jgi:hypothetical protein